MGDFVGTGRGAESRLAPMGGICQYRGDQAGKIIKIDKINKFFLGKELGVRSKESGTGAGCGPQDGSRETGVTAAAAAGGLTAGDAGERSAFSFQRSVPMGGSCPERSGDFGIHAGTGVRS